MGKGGVERMKERGRERGRGERCYPGGRRQERCILPVSSPFGLPETEKVLYAV